MRSRHLWISALAASIAVVIVTLACVPGSFGRRARASVPGADSSPAAQTGEPLTMLVVDTSGSMADDDGTGTVKINGAKAALTDFVRGIDPGAPVGLRTYPGGSEQDSSSGCSTGTLQVEPPGPSDPSLLDAAIRGLVPDGDTPTGPALNAAAADIRKAGFSSATIVLVSDGESNCGPDPCDIAGQIVASGIDVTVDTVGFQVSSAGQQQLQCIATKTHGSYSDVKNVQQLIDELRRLSKSLLAVKLGYPAKVKAATGEDATGQVHVTATMSIDGSQPVQDVQVGFSFATAPAPAIIGPNRRIGNLNPGETRAVTFTFRSPIETEPRDLDFAVSARGANSSAAVALGKIHLDQTFSLADTGPLLRNRKRAVILGDSYSAGEGAGAYQTGSETKSPGCHRSAGTYAVALYQPGNIDNFACSGAISADLLAQNKKNPNEPPQYTRLLNSPYNIAYMTIGGNDIGFAQIGKICAALAACEELPWAPRRRRTFRTEIMERIAALPAVLTDRLGQLESVLNNQQNVDHRGVAPLVLLAYPSPVPPSRGATTPACGAFFDGGEVQFLNEVIAGLNGAVEAAAKKLREEGRPVYFAPNVVDAFQPDHTYCSGDTFVHRVDVVASVAQALKSAPAPYVATFLFGSDGALETQLLGFALDTEANRTKAQEQVHPLPLGYRAMTAQLVRWSTSPAARVPVTRNVPRSPVVDAGATQVLHVTTASLDAATLDVQPAGTIVLQGSGFAPGSTIDVAVRSAPALLARVPTDSHGRVRIRVALPTDLRVGDHTLEISGLKPSGAFVVIRAPLHVTRPTPWWVWPLAAGGLAALAAALVLWFLARRKRDPQIDRPPTGGTPIPTNQGAR
jgi:hypothetical protein